VSSFSRFGEWMLIWHETTGGIQGLSVHGRRTITLPDFLVTELRAHRQA